MSYERITDLRISLALHLHERLGDAPRGPGWYLDARHGGGERPVVNRLRIRPIDALDIARYLDRLGLGTKITPAVADANETARFEMQRLANQAEEAAERARRAAIYVAEFEQQ